MRIVFAGTPEVAVPSLRRIADSGHEVAGVISRPDAVSGRGRKVRRSPVAQFADDRGIPVITPRRLSEPGVTDTLRTWAPDCAAVVAYGGLIPAGMLELPRHGWVNLHFSVLPAWRGAAPVPAAIAAGDEMTGASTFLIEEALDTGPVFGTLTEPIGAADTSGDVLERLSMAGADLLLATLDGIADGSVRPVVQPSTGVSLAPKIEVDDARIRWDLPAHIVDRQIRAFTPAPGAWTTVGDARIKVGPVADADPAANGTVHLAPGALAVTKQSVLVGTGSDPVRLGWVQPPGKKQMPAADWARGAHLDDTVVLR